MNESNESEIYANLTTFIDILKIIQTSQLLVWTDVDYFNAVNWAIYFEKLTAEMNDSTVEQKINQFLCKETNQRGLHFFQDKFSFHCLKNARIFLWQRLIQSSFLSFEILSNIIKDYFLYYHSSPNDINRTFLSVIQKEIKERAKRQAMAESCFRISREFPNFRFLENNNNKFQWASIDLEKRIVVRLIRNRWKNVISQVESNSDPTNNKSIIDRFYTSLLNEILNYPPLLEIICLGLTTPTIYYPSKEEKLIEDKVNESVLYFIFEVLLPIIELRDENEDELLWNSKQLWSLDHSMLIHISDLYFPFFRHYFAYLIGELRKIHDRKEQLNDDRIDDEENELMELNGENKILDALKMMLNYSDKLHFICSSLLADSPLLLSLFTSSG